MVGVGNIVLLALGALAYASEEMPDKLANRASQVRPVFVNELEDTMEAKRTGGMNAQGEYVNRPYPPVLAYKNGKMGPDRVFRKAKAKDVAKERGLPFDPSSIFNFASPRLVDAELSLGETGFFGNKEKFYKDGDGDWLKDTRSDKNS